MPVSLGLVKVFSEQEKAAEQTGTKDGSCRPHWVPSNRESPCDQHPDQGKQGRYCQTVSEIFLNHHQLPIFTTVQKEKGRMTPAPPHPIEAFT